MHIVTVLSGGLDSAVLLYRLHHQGHHVEAVTFDYGQKHAKEQAFAKHHCAHLDIRHDVIRLPLGHILHSALTDADAAVPDGHYAEDTMKATVVPNRNMIMLAVAGGVAISRKADALAYGAHAGDHAIYPDCRAEFVRAMAEALALSDWSPPRLLSPFVAMTKAEIVAEGAALGVPMQETWSCYKGGEIHCGICGTCVERREAFWLAGIEDRTPYAATEEETRQCLTK